MGGTFNPIHHGHLLIAETAYNSFGLDRVLFVPNGAPPHKGDLLSGEHRINMVKLAIADNPHFRICTLESFGKKDAEYTANTLKDLRTLFPGDEFYFITGADALISMADWKTPEEIFSECSVITTMRPGKKTDELDYAIANLKQTYEAKIFKMKMPLVDISSTEIRSKTKSGESVQYLIPDKVREYILDERLYV